MPVIDPTRTWEPLEQRLADTTDRRHRIVLSAVIEHMKAEAEPDLDALMATLSETPDYHFWNAGVDRGPKGTDGVRRYYADFLATRANILEFDIDRVVVDDYCVVTEGFLKQIYPGAYAARLGLPIDDEAADYLVTHRQLILWPVDEDGRIMGEDSYQSGPADITRLRPDELPRQYVELIRSTS
ncbi:nuclear transport factor 2 family protein [Nocardia cyriacigeorgica]|uniref:nuclear transport factor 2 family protein n=1 Tax=Nocardia cyriacigeorgica TaxID=135487 RepID=UPI00189422FC|nr:nuclear transport factor 2 family protein [Nocardia cyriacigeorgica]MBF6089513.1 nuclear transport factor 2 family protein [Nocardia cyriacigeorgica]MBF6094526.1 nuclear transport factor 2 family protein [Nocardia cyriacigeorgica]MBF6158774.1 nuclear transport factor 2 family protein [Nocardia cyriacigeorgica]MBF6197540.1 nuclear transport factor 2 family protein [Nocardia cyriacigeorgica]MBF6395834.1 nuclear transport factor 2 family protein [Nocardia cyriacigeorgica]